jgi:hypothetical protein
MKPKHVQNQAVKPSWGQLWRETLCSIFGHMFHVGSNGHYVGLPQSHCWRCGKKDRTANPACPEWEAPIG